MTPDAMPLLAGDAIPGLVHLMGTVFLSGVLVGYVVSRLMGFWFPDKEGE